MPSTSNSRKVIESVFLLLIIVAAVLIGWLWKVPTSKPDQAVTVWLLNMGLLVAFALIAGHIITGVWRGVLIDSSNKISLSRLQMILWTVLILSGFLVAVLINIHRGESEPLSITLDKQLWALMGISTASLVGSPLIKNSKKSERPNAAAEAKAKAVMADHGIDTASVKAEGKILVNEKPEDAAWTDIFKGEESGNGAYLDLGKTQMFFFTLVTWSVYAIALGDHFMKNVAQGISGFPVVDGSMVALLGISHAGYLANKAVPHTPEPAPVP
jgi:hypothetical protein